jgi:formate hydrogenlyase transcriptional activator
MNKVIETICVEAMAALARYHWPGNVRELQNLIERSVILSRGGVLDPTPPVERRVTAINARTEVRTLADAEREHILRVLEDSDWVIGGPDGAAARLGVKRTTLLDKMRRLGITRPQN